MRRLANGMLASGLPQRWVAARVLPRARAMRLLQKRRVSMARRRGVRPASLPPTAFAFEGCPAGRPGRRSDHTGRRPDGSLSSGRVRTRNSSVSLPLAAAFSAAAFWEPIASLLLELRLDSTHLRRPRPREQRFHASRAAARPSPRRAASPRRDDRRRGEHQQRRTDFGVV